MNIDIPSGALLIIDRLEKSGNSAYIVGGAVRDALMGRVADDFDITTSMKPDAMKLLFSDLKTIETGIKHGTLTVLADGSHYEVTTYRIDGEYDDFRHPGEVSFTDRIEDDLARRDFTVNAIAYSPTRGICDPYGGLSDLKAGVIRAVGDPDVRFSEDALRIMRAIRFSAVLGFGIEENTELGIYNKLPLLANVSRERIMVEWKKLLSGKDAYPVLNRYREAICSTVCELSGFRLYGRASFDMLGPIERMIYLYSDLEPDAWLSSMESLKADNNLKKLGKNTLAVLSALKAFDEDVLAHSFAKHSEEEMRYAVNIARAKGTYDEAAVKHLEVLIGSSLPRTLSELAVKGEDIMSLGFKGESIGKVLLALHIAVVKGRVKNEKEKLISYAQSKNFCI